MASPLDDMSKEWLKEKKPRMCVWDFDLTILRIHAFGSRIQPADVARRSLEDDVADLDFFRAFVLNAVENKVQVAVASFGRYDVIQPYLTRIFPDRPDIFNRENICTPTDVGYPDGTSVPGGKVQQLDLLVKRFLQPPAEKSQVMFFDDDKANIKSATKATYTCFYTPQGFTRDEMQKK